MYFHCIFVCLKVRELHTASSLDSWWYIEDEFPDWEQDLLAHDKTAVQGAKVLQRSGECRQEGYGTSPRSDYRDTPVFEAHVEYQRKKRKWSSVE